MCSEFCVLFFGIMNRFNQMDPLCEKYYSVSPYAYCMNNPVRYIDPDGRDGMVTGRGTKDDPYVITANYYYENGSLNGDEIDGLNGAVDSYNKFGGKSGVKIKNADGSVSYVKFNLGIQGVDNVSAAMFGDNFAQVGDKEISYGNRLGTEANRNGNGNEFGSANATQIDINRNNIAEGVESGHFQSRLIKATYIHEIGHNLGLDHSDKTTIMKQNNLMKINSMVNGTSIITDYASIDKRGVRLMVNRINVPRVSSLGILMTK